MEQDKCYYNEIRTHGALGGKTPERDGELLHQTPNQDEREARKQCSTHQMGGSGSRTTETV
jgi:hypothetical protein